MGILIGGFLMVFGLLWMAITGGIYFATASFVPGMSFPSIQFVPGPVLFVIGALMLVRGIFRARAVKGAIQKVVQQGVAARGSVTFVDKNYRLLVNQKPIYSIVEFTFRDAAGNMRTGRKEDVDSDLVIRNRIEVGSEIDLKYLPDNPDETILLLSDPRTGQASVSF